MGLCQKWGTASRAWVYVSAPADCGGRDDQLVGQSSEDGISSATDVAFHECRSRRQRQAKSEVRTVTFQLIP